MSFVRNRYMMACCCPDQVIANVRCSGPCPIANFFPGCRPQLISYTIAGGIDTPVDSQCYALRTGFADNVPDAGGAYLLGCAGGLTWRRYHEFGGVSVEMELGDWFLDDPATCKRYIKRLQLRSRTAAWAFECRNGVPYVSSRCSSFFQAPFLDCFPWFADAKLYPRVFVWPQACAVQTMTVVVSGANGDPGAGLDCFCTEVNGLWALRNDDIAGHNVVVDGNCVSGDWVSDPEASVCHGNNVSTAALVRLREGVFNCENPEVDLLSFAQVLATSAGGAAGVGANPKCGDLRSQLGDTWERTEPTTGSACTFAGAATITVTW